MRKLEKAFKVNLILIVIVALLVVLFITTFGQAQDGPATPKLTKTETLQLSVLAKDVQLANKDVQLARMQFLSLSQIATARQQKMDAEVQRIRNEHNLPTAKFTFDLVTLKFTPVPGKKAE